MPTRRLEDHPPVLAERIAGVANGVELDPDEAQILNAAVHLAIPGLAARVRIQTDNAEDAPRVLLPERGDPVMHRPGVAGAWKRLH